MSQEMDSFFREIWDEREDEVGYCYCYETGQPMHGSKFRSNRCCYDHILEKSVYPQYKFLKKNIVILHPEVHAAKGSGVTPKLNKLREKMLSLHNENKLI